MFEPSKTSVILSKLTRLTFDGELIWEISHPPEALTLGTSSKFPYYAETKYKNGYFLGYFEERYKHYSDEDSFEWCETSRLILLDSYRRVIYTFPQSTALSDLSQAIHESAANIDDVFSDLLEKSKETDQKDITF